MNPTQAYMHLTQHTHTHTPQLDVDSIDPCDVGVTLDKASDLYNTPHTDVHVDAQHDALFAAGEWVLVLCGGVVWCFCVLMLCADGVW